MADLDAGSRQNGTSMSSPAVVDSHARPSIPLQHMLCYMGFCTPRCTVMDSKTKNTQEPMR